MITYEDLLDRFAKMAEDRLGAGGLLASQGEANPAQTTPSHDAKEKADLPDSEPQKHTFDDGKVKKGPEEQKINKNVFMTRSGNSTIKRAFVEGFLDELEKAGIEGKPLGRVYAKGSEQKARDLAAKLLKGRRPGGAHPEAGRAFAKKSLLRWREQASPQFGKK